MLKQQRIAGGFPWWAHQFHPRFMRCPASLANIAIEATTNDVFPRSRPAAAFRHHVVQTQPLGSIPAAAVLAYVIVAEKNITPIEFDRISRQPLVPQQPHHPWYLNFKIDGLNPVAVIGHVAKFQPQQARFQPAVEIVGLVAAVLNRNDFGQTFKEQAESASHGNDMDGSVLAIEGQYAGVYRGRSTGNHQPHTPC